MSVLSKFVGKTLGFHIMTASCHEFGHTWNPNCYFALTDALGDALFFCFKTYGFLYLINSTISASGNPKKIKWCHILKNTIRSSIFLTTNLMLLIFLICRMRQFFGFSIWPTVSFVSSFTASLISIFIEAKKRRVMLALYLSNLASESIFRQLLNRKKISKIPCAQTIIFSIGLGVIFQLLSIKNLDNETQPQADAKVRETSAAKMKEDNYLRNIIFQTHVDMRTSTENKRIFAIQIIRLFLNNIPNKLRQYFIRDCNFNENKFVSQEIINIITTIKHSMRNFFIALCANILLTFLKNITRPIRFLNLMSLFKMPLFFGLMPLLYQFANYILYRIFGNRGLSISSGICGAVSGLAMLVWPNTNISMYIFWKAIEMSYKRLVGVIPILSTWNYGDALLYACASGYIVGLAIIEPHSLRSNYYNFLTNLTGNRIHLFNRELLARNFGFDSNRLYRDAIPSINKHYAYVNPQLYYTSRAFKPYGNV